MLFAVVRLRIAGRCLTRSEIEAAPRAIGDLRFEDPPHPRSMKRLVRIAELYGQPIGGRGQYAQSLIYPLMNPEIVSVDEESMVLFGFECRHVGDHRQDYVQGWLVTATRPGETLMKRGDVPM